MPQSIRFQPTSFLMSDDEVYRLTGLFADLGFKKFRLTGGEPTVRPGILGIIHHLSQLPGVEDVVMTTNGMRLAALAQPLAHAGLRRVNISIDALDAQTFQRMTSRGDFEKVWTGIIAAERAGLTPIKLNAVIARGYNDKSVTALAKLTLNHAWQVRFIELMPLGDMASFSTQHFVSEEEMRRRIAAEFMPLLPVNDGKLDGEARLYQFPDGLGTVGFISSVSQPFCAQCNRARLTADGILRLCLLQNGEVDLLTPLRAGASDDELREMIYSGLYRKPWGHQLSADIAPVGRVMSQIGG
jgi:cyclic pyranopterin phosphate synthase